MFIYALMLLLASYSNFVVAMEKREIPRSYLTIQNDSGLAIEEMELELLCVNPFCSLEGSLRLNLDSTHFLKNQVTFDVQHILSTGLWECWRSQLTGDTVLPTKAQYQWVISKIFTVGEPIKHFKIHGYTITLKNKDVTQHSPIVQHWCIPGNEVGKLPFHKHVLMHIMQQDKDAAHIDITDNN